MQTVKNNLYRRRWKNLALPFLFLVVWAGLTFASYNIIVTQRENRFDFFPRWYGAREMLRGEDPYSMDLNRVILEEMGYAEYIPYKHNFLYPATITWILLPFWVVDFPLAVSAWTALQLLLLFTLPLLTFLLLDWPIKPLPLVTILLFSTFAYRHSMNVYLIGQFVVFILACLIMAWGATRSNRPWLAAIALVGATIRPEGALIAGAMLFDLVLERRWKTVMIWAGIMGGLFGLTLLQIGFWIPDFLDRVSGYRQCCSYTDPAKVLGSDLLAYPIMLVTVLWGVWMLWQMRPLPDQYRIPWSLSVVIVVCLLVVTQSKTYTLIYALLPTWLCFWLGRDRWWKMGLALLILVSPWIYLVVDKQFGVDAPLEQLVTPVVLGILLTYYWRGFKHYPLTEPASSPRMK